jgi:predicted aspartyl protease
MNGIVDDAGRALLKVQLKSGEDDKPVTLDIWIDTGFTGDLVLPQHQIQLLNLQVGSSIKAILGDGSATELNTFTCLLEWFGEWKQIEVIANQGRFPLLGTGLLLDRVLHIDYQTKSLSLM